jgi:arylsulfatase
VRYGLQRGRAVPRTERFAGEVAGEDNGWVLSLIYPVIIDFDKSIIKYPSITRYVGVASTDLVPNLQHPDNPVPLLKEQIDRVHIGGGGG